MKRSMNKLVKSQETRDKSQQWKPCGLAFDSRLSTLDFSRAGTTLSEVLISLLVMSIGVVSLATLFPISVLRSIQAAQLTHATIHRMNAEQLIGQFPRLVYDPDNDLNVAEHELEKFIVDPLGWNNDVLTAATANAVFGNNLAGLPNPLTRYNGGFNTDDLARRISYQADSWQMAGKGIPTASTTTSVTVPTATDLVTFANSIAGFANGTRVRITLFSPTGKESVTRDHTTANPLTIAGQTISWTDAVPWPAISRFRLEIFDQRFSWLLTVRKLPSIYPNLQGQGDAEVDVVVFHKRPFSVASEQLYAATFTGGSPQVGLTIPAGQKPFLKRGGFVFDSQNAYWYRIVQIPDNIVAPSTITITIDQAAKMTGTRAIALPGVVEVYPIGTISFDPNNPL